jgi:hypothetical protein
MFDHHLIAGLDSAHCHGGEKQADSAGRDSSEGFGGDRRIFRADQKMGHQTYFFVNCAVCGRPHRVSVQLLGTRVQCQHCNSSFTACDSASGGYAHSEVPANIRRAIGLLRAADRNR